MALTAMKRFCLSAFALLASAGASCSTSEPPLPKPERASVVLPEVRMLAVGDVNLGRQCGQSLLKKGPEYPFGHLRSWIESHDLAFCNLESNISEQNGETVKADNRLIFTAPPVAAAALKHNGWDIVSTANNHSVDYGLSALKQTISYLEKARVAYNGTALDSSRLYKPTYLEIKGCRIAFLAVTDITNGPSYGTRLEQHLNLADRERLMGGLSEASRKADVTILSYHGGSEYSDQPTSGSRQFLHWAIDNGVDLVIGHHPHVIQGIEWYRKALIIYSLGNFTFYQRSWPYWTDFGLAARILFNREGIISADFVPVRAHFQAELIIEGALRDKILSRLALLSDEIATMRDGP